MGVTDYDIKKAVEEAVKLYLLKLSISKMQIPVGVSNRHIHLSEEDAQRLFGKGYTLIKMRDLSQKGEYAAKETVTVIGPKGIIEKVRLLGPYREKTQVELLSGDLYKIGIKATVRLSGDTAQTPGVALAGPCAVLQIVSGVIVAKRHIHVSPEDAQSLGLRDGEEVGIRARGERGLVFDRVSVRIRPGYYTEFHIDLEEANAAGLTGENTVEIVQRGEQFL